MVLRRSGGFLAALFLFAGLTACSSKTYRDVSYGSDLGRGWVPEVGADVGDGATAETPGSGGAGGAATRPPGPAVTRVGARSHAPRSPGLLGEPAPTVGSTCQ